MNAVLDFLNSPRSPNERMWTIMAVRFVGVVILQIASRHEFNAKSRLSHSHK